MAKLKTCKHCGAEIAKNAKVAPTACLNGPLIVDEFEERCYLEAPTDAARLDAIMEELGR